jgi:poly(A) polymerase
MTSEGERPSATGGRRRRASALEAATRVAEMLHEAGHQAFFAGGCVRDRRLGLEPKDFDIATDARPEKVGRLFHRSHQVGEAFGVTLVRMWGQTIEVATFRTDGDYSDARRPDKVQFSTAEEDARRRDFTINGLFEDPRSGEVIDYVGGLPDLERKVLRAIGDPETRIREDRLRMLRAVRFAARFGLSIEGGTQDAIRAWATRLEGVSRERIGQELRLMLEHANRAVAAWELSYLGLDGPVLHEECRLDAPVRVGRLPVESPYSTVLAAWMLDRELGPPAEGEAERPSAAGGGKTPDRSERVDRWREALMLSNGETRGLRETLERYTNAWDSWPILGVAARKRMAVEKAFEEALLLIRAESPRDFVRICRDISDLAKTPSGLAPIPLATGDSLIKSGLTPGPLFGRVLDAVYDAQLEDEVTSEAEAIRLAKRLAEGL